MRILGIDPGFGIVGFGIIDYDLNQKFTYVAHGTIKTPVQAEFGSRLVEISDDMKFLLQKYKPDKVAIEQLFFAKNITTALKVSQAKGVILLEIARYGLEAVNVTPSQVKSGMTGNGKASKTEVKYMVKEFLKLDNLKGVDDAVDALAVAISGVHLI
jgi:crossover junction endodeoxyribonuclease RuvC